MLLCYGIVQIIAFLYKFICKKRNCGKNSLTVQTSLDALLFFSPPHLEMLFKWNIKILRLVWNFCIPHHLLRSRAAYLPCISQHVQRINSTKHTQTLMPSRDVGHIAHVHINWRTHLRSQALPGRAGSLACMLGWRLIKHSQSMQNSPSTSVQGLYTCTCDTTQICHLYSTWSKLHMQWRIWSRNIGNSMCLENLKQKYRRLTLKPPFSGTGVNA